MNEILATVLPVFGLILMGFAVMRAGLVKQSASEGLSQYVFVIGLPALLFRTMVEVNPPQQAPWGLWASYFGAVIVVWLLTIVLARTFRMLPGEESTSAAMGSGFSNLLMLGLPIIYGHYGAEATLAAALIISIHAPLQWTGATLVMEWQRQRSGLNYKSLLKGLVWDLIRNPIVMALIAGSLWRQTGLGLTPVLKSMLTMLSESSVPAALVALGFSLAILPLAGQIRPALLIVFLKMLVMPLVALALGLAFAVPPLWIAVAVIFAAIPTGANAYLFATRYQAALAPVSAAIGIGTALAAVSLPLVLWLLDNFLL
jgi:malonate transporter and related proteins